MSTIDHFKYKALLAELESIKGTIGPIKTFINKVFIISNNLSAMPENRESTRYAFILITRASFYSTAARKLTKIVEQKLIDVARVLCNYEVVTEGNILETYEFWKSTIRFSPSTLTELFRIEALLNVLERASHSYEVYVYGIRELNAMYYNSKAIIKLYLLGAIGPKSLIFNSLQNKDSFDSSKAIPALEEHLSNIQIILKEAHEQHSRGSTTI